MVRILFCLTNIFAFEKVGFMKRSILATLIVIILLSQIMTTYASPPTTWKWGRVNRVLDNKHIQLFDGRVIRILGMSPPPLFDKGNDHYCFARPFFRLLKLMLENKRVQIRADRSLPRDGNILPCHVKLEDGQNLSEFLLRRGKANVMTTSNAHSYVKKYASAEATARLEGLGIWKGCGGSNELHQRLQKMGSDLHHTPQSSYLSSVSVGRVAEVLSGNQFVLDNELRVRMLGMEIPSSSDNRSGISCFGKQAQAYLTERIIRKQVFLRRDISQMDEDGNLLRYVFLPQHDKRGQELFLNAQMIADGYGKYVPSLIDKKHENVLNNAQKLAYEEKKGAWRACLQAMLAEKN